MNVQKCSIREIWYSWNYIALQYYEMYRNIYKYTTIRLLSELYLHCVAPCKFYCFIWNIYVWNLDMHDYALCLKAIFFADRLYDSRHLSRGNTYTPWLGYFADFVVCAFAFLYRAVSTFASNVPCSYILQYCIIKYRYYKVHIVYNLYIWPLMTDMELLHWWTTSYYF